MNLKVLTFFLSGLMAGVTASAKMPLADSLKIAVTEGTNMAADLSPDKKTIAIDLQGTIWTLPADGGLAKPVTDIMGDCRQPAWSPDGNWIAFHAFWDGGYHLWMIKKDGSNRRQLTFGVYDDREPHWSPDGKELVFSSDRSGNYDIWKLNLTTGAVTQLTKNPANEYNPAWSADGLFIAFVSERAEGAGIYAIDAQGKEKILSNTPGKLAAPAWQPDGSGLVFNVLTTSQSSLKAVIASNGAEKIISEAAEDVFPFRVSWFSPTEILYTADGKLKRRKTDNSVSQEIPFQATLTIARRNYKRKAYDFDNQYPQAVKGIKGPTVS
ncbi:MAG: amidohydrolase, partial [Siphonobacter sp.]